MTQQQDNPQAGNRAGSASTNGHNGADFDAEDLADMDGRLPGDDGYNPTNKRSTNARHAENLKYGSSAAATVVGGLYAAEHGKAKGKLTDAGYAAVAALEGVAVTDAKAVGLVDVHPSEADVARWYLDRDQAWVPPSKATVDRAGLKAATKGLDAARKIALTAMDGLAAEGVPWAARAAAKAQADNLDTGVKAKTYSFTVAELYNGYRAPVGDLVGLTAMDQRSRLESLRLLKDWAAAENLRAQGDARKRLAAAEAAEIELPPITSLDALLAKPDDHVRLRIANLWPSGGAKVLCAAPAGAGKTTLSGNLVRSLADGDPFLGTFEVHQRAERIVIIDNEMTEEMLKRWLRRQGVGNTAAVVDVVNLRGRAGLFDLGSDRLREMWTRRLADLGCDFVIFDCLSPVINAMGLKEATELGNFLHPLTDMLTAAGVADVLVHHHMGHEHERARGDSTALGWSDANWKIVRTDGGDDRYFAADKVRDADDPVPEGLLSWDKGTGRLTYTGGDRTATGKKEVVEQRITAILEVLADHHAKGLKDNKGMGVTELKKAVGGNKAITDEALAVAASKERKLVILKEEGRAKWYRIKPEAMDPTYVGDDSEHADGGIAEVINLRQSRDSGPKAN